MMTTQSLIIILIVASTTLVTRILPFILFPANKKTPAFIEYLGKVLPHAVFGLLVIYCLKDVTIFISPYAIPEILSILLIILVHIWKRQTLLSIAAGTICYMVLVQTFF